MSSIKTLATDKDPMEFINSVSDETKRHDAMELIKLLSKITNEMPVMWGTSIIGFGSYHYRSVRSSQEGDWPLIGFSPRKQNLTIYIMPGFEKYRDFLKNLGKHKTSVGCLYINKLADVDKGVLEDLLKAVFEDMKETYGQD